MVLLRTSPHSFELLCHGGQTYRFSLRAAGAAGTVLADSDAAAKTTTSIAAAVNWTALGLGKTSVDRWMQLLKSYRQQQQLSSHLGGGNASSSVAPSVEEDSDRCALCDYVVPVSTLYRLDQHLGMEHRSVHTCRACLRSHVLHDNSNLSASAIELQDFSMQDLSDLLTDSEYAQFVERSTQQLFAPLPTVAAAVDGDLENAVISLRSDADSLGSAFAPTGALVSLPSATSSSYTRCPSCCALIHLEPSSSLLTENATEEECARVLEREGKIGWWKGQTGSVERGRNGTEFVIALLLHV